MPTIEALFGIAMESHNTQAELDQVILYNQLLTYAIRLMGRMFQR